MTWMLHTSSPPSPPSSEQWVLALGCSSFSATFMVPVLTARAASPLECRVKSTDQEGGSPCRGTARAALHRPSRRHPAKRLDEHWAPAQSSPDN